MKFIYIKNILIYILISYLIYNNNSISGLINLRIDNYNGHNINTGSVMTFEGDGIFNIT